MESLISGKEKTIIFVKTKNVATDIWEIFHSKYPDQVAIHHSSLTTEIRRQTERDFREGRKVLVIATVGFGMVVL